MGITTKEYHEGYQQGFKDAKKEYETRLKADMVDMLKDLKQDLIAEAYGIEMDCTDYVVDVADIDKVIQQKINTFKENKDEV